MIKRDLISEMVYGKGAIRTPARILTFRTADYKGKKREKRSVVIALVAGQTTIDNSGNTEMWDCDIILIPKAKYAKNTTTTKFENMRADQKLLSYDVFSPESWEKQIFP